MQMYANEGCHGVCGGETVVTGRGMRLKRATGSGRALSTHNALWCLFTHCGGLWDVRGEASHISLSIFCRVYRGLVTWSYVSAQRRLSRRIPHVFLLQRGTV